MSARTPSVEVHPLTARFGAEVRGLRRSRSGDLTRADVEDLKDALLDYKVLLLRRQHLDADAHRRLVRRFGPVTDLSPAAPTPWVSAASYRHAPPKLLSFRAGPGAGRRLRFADAVHAYRDLPRPLRALADRSWVVHRDGADDDDGAGVDPVAHPVTRLHTETGDRALLLGAHARQALGLSDVESRTVLDLLQAYLEHPRNVLTCELTGGDVVLADARAVHYQDDAAPTTAASAATTSGTPGSPGTSGSPGTVRIHVASERPLGVNGQHSHVLTALSA